MLKKKKDQKTICFSSNDGWSRFSVYPPSPISQNSLPSTLRGNADCSLTHFPEGGSHAWGRGVAPSHLIIQQKAWGLLPVCPRASWYWDPLPTPQTFAIITWNTFERYGFEYIFSSKRCPMCHDISETRAHAVYSRLRPFDLNRAA